MENFEKAFETFIQGCQRIVNKGMEQYTTQDTLLEVRKGRKYYKVVALNVYNGKDVSTGGSAWAFINTENGDVLKPASWNAPAKHARGNIYDDNNGLRGISTYGPAYLR